MFSLSFRLVFSICVLLRPFFPDIFFYVYNCACVCKFALLSQMVYLLTLSLFYRFAAKKREGLVSRRETRSGTVPNRWDF